MAFAQAIYMYPIKSCGGQRIETISIPTEGIEGDRSLVVVAYDVDRGSWHALTQRDPGMEKLARITARREGERVIIAHPDVANLLLTPMTSMEAPTQDIIIHGEHCQGIDQGARVAQWLSKVLKKECRLMHVHPHSDRILWANASGMQHPIGFRDASPVLLTSSDALDRLNTRLKKAGKDPVPMDRFRPNIVVGGTKDGEEDCWKTIRIGNVKLIGYKLCSRCAITSVDQQTGKRMRGGDPLRTLSSYRPLIGKVPTFGMNFVVQKPGWFRVTDAIEVVERWDEPPTG